MCKDRYKKGKNKKYFTFSLKNLELQFVTEGSGHSVTYASGQFSQQIPRFGQRAGVCPYKFEKNCGKFLESEEKRRNFASSKTVSITFKNYKIMAKMNEMSARALTMEELENVNGGGIPRGGKLTVRVK